jgi:tRNA (guanine-N7-)-methyltransferase
MPVTLSIADTDYRLGSLSIPLRLNDLLPESGLWEVEIGFGKGRYLLKRAAENPDRRFLGIEVANAYYRLALARARRQRLENLVLIRGEALFLMSTTLPSDFATALHVYFPDPWPKARHQKRRLFDPETVDLLLRLLKPGGMLYFATDHLDYGEVVHELLQTHPAVKVTARPDVWDDGARTNYEAKYMSEGRPILRLEITRIEPDVESLLHPVGQAGVVAAGGARVLT